MKKIFLSLMMFYCSCLQAAEFAEAYDISARGFEREANRVVVYYQSDTQFDLQQQKDQLNFINSSLQQLEAKYNNNPVFRFVQGLQARNMASLEQRIGNTAQSTHWLQKKQDYYLMAMALDKKQAPHLSAAVYATMKKGLGGDEKLQATQNELKLGGSGENDSYYWYLHWSNINQLQKQGKIEEAEKALAAMKKEIEQTGRSAEIYLQLAGKAKADLDKKKDQLKQAREKQTREKQASKPEREHKAVTKENVEEEYYGYLLLVGVVMLVLIAIGLVFETRRRRRR